MSERRQAFRRDPIEIELEQDGRLISVGPVPWEKRNEIGNEIIKQHTAELNEAVKLFVAEDGQTPQLEAKLANKLTDPFQVLQLGLASDQYEKVVDRKLYLNQITSLLIAIIEVNELAHLRALVDPNSSSPGGLGGIISTLIPTEDDTQKMESGPDFSPGASPEKTSEISPTPNLIGSSTT